MWPEILAVKSENKRELNLNAEKLTDLLTKNDGKIDVALFEQQQLNFLQLTNSSEFCEISDDIQKLENLQTMLVFGNRLSMLPSKIILVVIASSNNFCHFQDPSKH
jgi:hypothetical protein